MAVNNKPKTMYAPGELSKVREKLGDMNEAEAKRMAQLLGGEVGYERSVEPDPKTAKKRSRHETVELVVGGKGRRTRGRGGRTIDIADGNEDEKVASKPASSAKSGLSANDPADDPSVPFKISYFERVKMDRYAGQTEFDIKSQPQVLVSMFSLFSDPPDYVSPRFVNKRMDAYYTKIEQLVTSTRSLFPRNNTKRNDRMKKTSPFVYAVLDTIRYWNIEKIAGDMAKIQAHPRQARVTEFSDILRAVYKPLFILDNLDMDTHIKGAYKLLYKILYIENPMDAKEKFQDLIRNSLSALVDIRRDVHFCLYPLLMKLISDRWLPYERIFVDRRRRFMSFLGATEHEQIPAVDLSPQQVESGDVEALKADVQQEQSEAQAEEEDADDPEVIARKAREAERKAERKALDRGIAVLEALFPQAGWDKLEEYPDLYPYFADTYSLRRGYELIAPTDPLQQIATLMHILEDIFIGIRYVTFGTITGSDGNPVEVVDYLGDVINNWRRFIDDSFGKEYLPRLNEYCRLLENSSESRTSIYARKAMNDLHWVKRLYFLPFYKFESLGPPPMQKQDVTAIYSEIRMLRKYLTAVAIGIEQGTRMGGAEAKAPCDGINNPWESYNFEVPNPVSTRLDTLLGSGKRNNASLIFFSLSITTVLDYIVNNENSWAYGSRPGPLFRSIGGEGITPMFGVEKKLDAGQIFKDVQKRKSQQKA